jgi:hypothetical protein
MPLSDKPGSQRIGAYSVAPEHPCHCTAHLHAGDAKTSRAGSLRELVSRADKNVGQAPFVTKQVREQAV